MTVGELKKELEKFDDSLEVGGSGHFDELLELYSVDLDERKGQSIVEYVGGASRVAYLLGLVNGLVIEKETPLGPCVKLYIESAGNEPD